MDAPRAPSPARGQRLRLVHRAHHQRRELAAGVLDLRARGLERLGKLGLGELPFLCGAAGDELDVVLRLPRQPARARKPRAHALGARRYRRRPPARNCRTRWRRSASRLAEWTIADFGSNGSSSPRSSAVPGMNWAMPCAPFGLTACGIEAALLPDQPHERHRRQSPRLGLLLHDRTDDVDEGLGPGQSEARFLDAGFDPRVDACLHSPQTRAGEARPRSATVRMDHIMRQCRTSLRRESIRLDVGASSSARCKPRHRPGAWRTELSASSRLSVPMRAEYCRLVPMCRSQVSTTMGS